MQMAYRAVLYCCKTVDLRDSAVVLKQTTRSVVIVDLTVVADCMFCCFMQLLLTVSFSCMIYSICTFRKWNMF